MKDDFLTIYGDKIEKTGSFHWEEELEEARQMDVDAAPQVRL